MSPDWTKIEQDLAANCLFYSMTKTKIRNRIMLKVKQKVVVKGGFGSEKPVRVRIDAISTKNDREIIEYTDWDGQDRWAYVSQIIDFNPDGEPVEPSKPTCDKCGKFTDEREGQFTVCGTAWVCPSCKTELDEMDEEPTVKPPTNFDVIESLNFIWDRLHGYREDCIPVDVDGEPYDEEWDDICTAMSWIEDVVNQLNMTEYWVLNHMLDLCEDNDVMRKVLKESFNEFIEGYDVTNTKL